MIIYFTDYIGYEVSTTHKEDEQLLHSKHPDNEEVTTNEDKVNGTQISTKDDKQPSIEVEKQDETVKHNNQPETEEELILSQMVNPQMEIREDSAIQPQYEGVHLKTVDAESLKIICSILVYLDAGKDLDYHEFFMNDTKTDTLTFPQLYKLLCNVEYLGLPKIVLQKVLKKCLMHRDFIKYNEVKEYFIASIPESLTPLSLYFSPKFLVAWYLGNIIDENILEKDNEGADLVKHLYTQYSMDRVKDREEQKEKSFFLFDDQLFYLPLQYHAIQEEEEEHKLDQLEFVREKVTLLLGKLRTLFTQQDNELPDFIWSHYNTDWLDEVCSTKEKEDTTEDIQKEEQAEDLPDINNIPNDPSM